MTEIWDDDNDFDLSDGAFEASHAASTSTSTSIENGTVLNAATKEIRANQVQGDASTLAEIDGVAFMIPFDPFKCTEINEAPEMSSLSKEEQDQGSANSVKTVRGCADSAPFSESSTSSDNLQSSSACATDLLGITAVVEQTTTHIDDDCHPIDAPTTSSVTLRKSSSLSRLLALSASGPGRVRHLGSTPHGAAKSVLGGWDEDLNLDGLASGLRPLRAKSSFTSHISDDLQDDELETGLPTPQSTRKVIDFMTDRADLVAFKEQEDAVDPGNDFDLPDDQRSLAFSPTLARPSSSSLGSIQRRSSVAGCSLSEPLSLPSLDDRRGHRHLSSSPALTHGNDTTTTEDELTEDENFFDDIVLPARLLGGPGALTPPPEDEKSVKLSLQALLKHNLEIRRGRGLDKTKDASAALANARLAEYREVQDDDTGESEYGLVLEPGIRLGKDRIHSRPRPQLQGSLKDRRSSSTSAVTPSSCAPKTAAPLRRHATLPAVYSASNLTNSPAPTRQGSHRGGKNVTGQEKPISPSESEDLPSEVSTVAPLRFRRLTAKVSSSNQSPSLFVNRLTAPAAHPATKTLSRKSSANSLLSMRSQTLERKRSLQEIGSRMPFRQTLRSPSPASSVTNAGPRPGSSGLSSQASFAAPTASSMSRVRERVMSSPMIVPPSPVPFVRHSLHAPPRPSSAASGRFSQPTLASASKVRGTPARSISTPVSGLRIPAIPLHLARPRSAGDFGDGTELDGFDDLPTDRLRERERTVSNATARQARLSGVESARLGSGSRRAQNGSSSSTSSGASAVRKRLAESGSVKNKVDTQLGSQASDTRKTSAAGKDKPRKRKREPQLIRNLSGVTASKTQGDMTWNATLHRWEGNESVLKDFDKALATSTRPALITHLSTGRSPGKPSSDDTPKLAVESTASGVEALRRLGSAVTSIPLVQKNVKIVGSMVFDPSTMRWLSINPDEEDELNLDFEATGDWADDEGGEEPAADRGERERMLKSRASFVASDTGDFEGGQDGLGSRALRDECIAGERRHVKEMRTWTRYERAEEAREMREELWDIRKLILDIPIQSAP